MKLNNREVIAVDVPDGERCEIIENRLVFAIPESQQDKRWTRGYLPEGNWHLLGRASEITEEVLWKYFVAHPDSTKKIGLNPMVGFQSWCRANNITNQVLLIQKP